MNLTIKTYRDDTYVEEMTTVESVVKIGKLKSSHICLNDEAVARMHAVIEVSGDEVRVIDLGSPSGTNLNGTKVHKNALLDSRDVLTVGPYRLVVTFGSARQTVLRTADEMRAHLNERRAAAARRSEEEFKETERRFEQEIKEDLAVLLGRIAQGLETSTGQYEDKRRADAVSALAISLGYAAESCFDRGDDGEHVFLARVCLATEPKSGPAQDNSSTPPTT